MPLLLVNITARHVIVWLESRPESGNKS